VSGLRQILCDFVLDATHAGFGDGQFRQFTTVFDAGATDGIDDQSPHRHGSELFLRRISGCHGVIKLLEYTGRTLGRTVYRREGQAFVERLKDSAHNSFDVIWIRNVHDQQSPV
jgi:hypothetical protein